MSLASVLHYYSVWFFTALKLEGWKVNLIFRILLAFAVNGKLVLKDCHCEFYEWYAVYDDQCLLCISISWLKFLAEVGASKNQVSNSRECQSDAGKLNLLPSPLSIGVLHEIARRCDTKVQMCFDLTRDALPPPHPSPCAVHHILSYCAGWFQICCEYQ